MRPRDDMTGRRFGKWTVLGFDPDKRGHSLCKCDCGVVQSRKESQLRWAEKAGINQACQACAATKHGKSKTPEFKVWNQMHDRCRRENHPAFMHYGGRGIGVCDRWKSFENFIADMGPRPSSKHSIDRIDNNGNYDPDNCRWAVSKTQTRNQSTTVMLSLNGKTQCIMDWAVELGMSHAVIWQRINTQKWSVEQALCTPVGKACNWRGTGHKDAIQYELNGEKHSLSQLEKLLGVSRSTLYSRIRRGVPLV